MNINYYKNENYSQIAVKVFFKLNSQFLSSWEDEWPVARGMASVWITLWGSTVQRGAYPTVGVVIERRRHVWASCQLVGRSPNVLLGLLNALSGHA